MDYRKSHLQPEKGNAYHASFINDPYRRMVWELEKEILNRILLDFYSESEINHLDFACGTGRILLYLEDRTKRSLGVDLSPSMLEVARKYRKCAEVIDADLTKHDILGNRKFNLITAFRFFPNAQPQLRLEAIQVLRRHLEKNGFLVFNNHMNTACIKYRLARFLGRGGHKGMSIEETKRLTDEAGFDIVKIYHLCVLPVSDRFMLLREPLLKYIEKSLARVSILSNLGENLIFVCKRARLR